jgi:glucosamine--fructose-6-phosphate aminotransferase (isomerizing)
MTQILQEDNIKKVKKVSKSLTKSKTIIYIGRGISQVTAFEAALKLRELSYINSQGIAAGELKHGSIALVDKKSDIIVLAARNPKNQLFEKTLSNAQEVNARNGKITFISDKTGISQFASMAKYKIETPPISGDIQEALLPVIYTQLIAYYVALYKGNDVDQPRNLAKSVTVE